MRFICKGCVEDDHCGRGPDDTWCDCQHKARPPRPGREENEGQGPSEEGQRP